MATLPHHQVKLFMLLEIPGDIFIIQGIFGKTNMTGETIFSINFSEPLNFVNIFCRVQFISNKLCGNGSRMKSKKSEDWKPEEVKWKEGDHLSCNADTVKTLTRKLSRKNSYKKYKEFLWSIRWTEVIWQTGNCKEQLFWL